MKKPTKAPEDKKEPPRSIATTAPAQAGANNAREVLDTFRSPGFLPRNYPNEVSAIRDILSARTAQIVTAESVEQIMWAVSEYHRHVRLDRLTRTATSSFKGAALKTAAKSMLDAVNDRDNAYAWAAFDLLRRQGIERSAVEKYLTAIISACEQNDRTGMPQARKTDSPGIDLAVKHLINAWNGSSPISFEWSSKDKQPPTSFLKDAFATIDADIPLTRLKTAVGKFNSSKAVKKNSTKNQEI